MKTEWKEIPKDKYGFFDEESDLYDRLPIIVTELYDDNVYIHYIDKDNWDDSVADLSRQRFKYYIEVEPIPTIKGGQQPPFFRIYQQPPTHHGQTAINLIFNPMKKTNLLKQINL